MKKPVLLCLASALGIFLCIYFYNHTSVKSKPTVEEVREEEEEGEKEDGIRLAQEQDFKNTVDLSLGYIPEYRLIEASEKLVNQRRMMRGNASMRTSALSWAERGPYTDAIGPNNGNTRGPGSTAVTSGRIRAIWVDLSDASNHTVWVGGIDGGIWKTTDISASPANWTPINDFMGNLAVSSITQDPTNHNIMYFGTGEKSFNTDAVRGGGIWKSTDHGVTWNLLPNTTGFWNVSKILCDAAGNVYVGTIGISAGLQRSLDKGATWTNISPATISPTPPISLRIAELKISNTGRLHVVCGYYNTAAANAAYMFTDNPATVTSTTWTSPTTSFPPPQYNSEIAVFGNTLYALNSDVNSGTPFIYKSTDGGVNWATTATSPPVSANTNTSISSRQGWYCLAVGVDPANANNVVVGGLNTYRSSNGGNTWTQVARWFGTAIPYVHADQHFVTWNGNQVLIASDGGIFYSNDGGVTYSDRNVNLRLKQFYSVAIHPTSTNYFIAGAQDNGVHQLNSPGLGASVEVIGGDGAISHIDQDQPQYQFSAYVYNQYRRSVNSGANWGSVNHSTSPIGQFINPTDYDDLNNKLYAARNPGEYVRWENPQTGSLFTPVPVPAFNGSMVSHVMVSPYTTNRVYFGTDGGRIIKIDNADLGSPVSTNITGSTMNPTSVSCVAVGTTDDNLIATFSNYGSAHVWMSTTGGGAAGWINISGNLPDIPVRWAMFYPDDNSRAIIATEMGIYETDNINGVSTFWTQNISFPIVRTNMLQYRSSDGVVAAATHGRGLWTSSIPVTTTQVRFGTTLAMPVEATASASGCTGYKDYTIYLTVNRAPVGTATATINLTPGSATQGVDYEFTTNGNFIARSNTVTLASGSAAPQPINIRIYNDGAGESDETFTLTYTLSGATDAVAATTSQSFTCTIKDNDLAPSLSNSSVNYTVGFYDANLSNETIFKSSQQKHRVQVLYYASELTAMGATAGTITSLTTRVVTKNSVNPFKGFTISIANTALTDVSSGFVASPMTQVYTSNYSSVLGNNVFAFGTGAGSSSSFAWDGQSNIIVQFCFDNTPTAAELVLDFMEGNDPFGLPLTVYSNGGAGSGCSLGATFISTFRISSTFNFLYPANTVETALNSTNSFSQAVNNDIYYYNTNRKIMARIRDLSGFDYGCTQMTIDRAGNGASPFWSANNTAFLTDKTYRIVPTTNNPAGQYEITLYYTAAEKAGWEAATGNLWSNIRVIKVKSQILNYTPATPAPDGPNAVDVLVPTHGTYGADYTLTVTVNNGFSGFAAGIPGLNPLPVNLTSFTGRLVENNRSLLEWSTSSEQNSKKFDIEKSTDGADYFRIGSVQAAGSNSGRKDYSFTDRQLSPNNYYRLRMIDMDGREKLSQVVLLRVTGAKQNLWLVNNPFTDRLDLRLATEAKQVKMQLINAGGVVVAEKTFSNLSGQYQWQIPAQLSKGSYILRSSVDGEVFIHKLVKQ